MKVSLFEIDRQETGTGLFKSKVACQERTYDHTLLNKFYESLRTREALYQCLALPILISAHLIVRGYSELGSNKCSKFS